MSDLQTRLDPQRQAEIRRLLVAQASQGTVVTRSRRLALAGCVALVVTTGVAALTFYPDPPPPTYAAWTAVPQAAPPLTATDGEIESWASKCSDLGVGGVGVGGVPARPEAAARREVLVDRRGGFTYCVDVALGSGTSSDPLIALSGLKAKGLDGLNLMQATVSDKPFAKPQGSAVLVLGGISQIPSRGIQAFQLYGLSGPEVTGVDVVLTNGLQVTATARNGVWGVWWPSDRGDPAGCKLHVRTAAGVTLVDPDAVRLRIQ
ncbi:hypothetical protein JNW91_02585 [Micromonospora sp. STR1_7]|uniref:Uncharacterized protein n=1 Tax=Micromonospora parastrephiae TaxID=2806101 RepID=A0ABS1XNM3_9ACTN|nr:hypothetical protein [Micromonospora parastrephiae]MBM0230860.1 hypothetical protein [Micromonospora parastrephiae]